MSARDQALQQLRRRSIPLLALTIALVVLALIHHLLLQYLSGSVLIAKLLAPNLNEAFAALILGAVFLVLRIFLLAVAPPLVFALAGTLLAPPLVRLLHALSATAVTQAERPSE